MRCRCGTPGLKFICRETYDTGRSDFDRPLSSHYDEEDALAVFDDVLVPWERVFINGDIETFNSILVRTPGYAQLQATIRGMVKLSFWQVSPARSPKPSGAATCCTCRRRSASWSPTRNWSAAWCARGRRRSTAHDAQPAASIARGDAVGVDAAMPDARDPRLSASSAAAVSS